MSSSILAEIWQARETPGEELAPHGRVVGVNAGNGLSRARHNVNTAYAYKLLQLRLRLRQLARKFFSTP
jgi:hypothetical protein